MEEKDAHKEAHKETDEQDVEAHGHIHKTKPEPHVPRQDGEDGDDVEAHAFKQHHKP